MEPNPNSRPVLILGAASRVAVPIARLLRQRCGVSVDVAAMVPSDPRVHSRAIRMFTHLPDFLVAPDGFRKNLVALILANKYDMLIPVQDGAVTAIAQNYDELSSLLHVCCPPPHVVERVLNKTFTLKVAEDCKIRIPHTWTVSSAADVSAFIDQLQFPVVLKPRERKGAVTFKARYIYSQEELVASLTENPYGELLLQEYCPGEGVGIQMLMHRGECLATFQHRRLKEYPQTGGVAVMAIAEETAPQLAAASYRLLRALEWEGVAMVEFRRNPGDGSAVLMEVNGRYWGSASLPFLAGVEFPVYEWQLAHGRQPSIPDAYAVGMRWRWTAGYFSRLHGVIVGSGQKVGTRPAKLREVAQIPADFSLSIRDALWSLSDPLPALSDFGSTFYVLLKSDTVALLKRLLPRRLIREVRQYRRYKPDERAIYLKLKAMNMFRSRNGNASRVSKDARSYLFVCFGNIMRSPMCEALFKRALARVGHPEVMVSSAGLGATPGKPADPRALVAAREFGVSLEDHRATLLTREMVEQSDVIFTMDFQNQAQLLARYPDARHKVVMLSAYAEPALRFREIADPYVSDLDGTRQCYRTLQTCIDNLTHSLFPNTTHGVREQHAVPINAAPSNSSLGKGC